VRSVDPLARTGAAKRERDDIMTMRHHQRQYAGYQARNFLWQLDAGNSKVAILTLDRPEKKNPLTFDSYAELRDLFRGLVYAEDIKAVVITGAGGNFCSGGDVHEIIGPLTKMSMPELLDFTRMTGDLVKAMRACPQPIVAAVDGICAGAGAMVALAADLRYGTPDAKTAFLFTRVGLAGADMGACTLLPRMIGQGRAAELLYTGRAMTADEGLAWGFFNALAPAASGSVLAVGREPSGGALAAGRAGAGGALALALECARRLADGPTFAHGVTKKLLHQEWAMGLDEAIEHEAEAQAICMQTGDFHRAYRAFVAKEKPVFEGN
jgi:enoyl-CoA hydratase/carnithine racemase